MKQFFGAFFGSCLGILVTGVIMIIIVIASITSVFTEAIKMNTKQGYKPTENSVLRIDLDGEIKERSVKNPFGNLDLGPFMEKASVGLNDIIDNLKKAKDDKNIKGIYLEISDPSAGFATLEEVRNALVDFKTSGKFIYAYSELYSQKAYYLACTADKVYLNPQGGMEIKGLSTQLMFFKKMLEKLDMEVQIFRHGKFKSAIEPFMLDKMSDANRTQVEKYLGSLWGHIVEGISKSRNITAKDINDMADELSIRSPEDALAHKLVDELKYEDEVYSLIRKHINLGESDKIHFVSLDDYSDAYSKSKMSKDRIAVIYAVGEIESGDGNDQKIGSDRIVKAIRDARLDKNVKAIVLRVNSPGGSALASDVIWRETVLAQKTKPFIVSMGDVAASGGYYISCAADRIFAQPNTITGSIGVFGMIPNAQKTLSEKLGITIDTVNTNKHSDVGTILRRATTEEYEYIQQSVEHIYDVFISKVALGRKTSKNSVDSIGQGRVWSGADAIKINLVDELGGINDAIHYAAKQAKITDYKIMELPKQRDPLQELLGHTEEEMEARAMKASLGDQYLYMKQLKNVLKLKGVQARLPYEMIIQ
ncbi:MAG: signal peptide peptidase SppA, type [Bacteroidetes bacterium]|jgi:protease-4|nr:signal peptide peptidase SppA, type [Bacteroidota bacterium]MDF2453616.1 signal peptide peptidase SppA, type [Bacteroidota bacterium]